MGGEKARTFLVQEYKITYANERKIHAEPCDIRVNPAHGRQKHNAQQHSRRADEVEEKGLFLKSHAIKHTRRHYRKAHGQ